MTSVTIPEGIENIGQYAFYMCTHLTSVDLPDHIDIIGEGAFMASGLTSLTFPLWVTQICDNMCRNCNSLTSVSLPESIRYVGNNAFRGCDALTDVYYDYSEEHWEVLLISDMIGENNEPLTEAEIHCRSVIEGRCGENVWYVLGHDGTLTISGTGEMYQYDEETSMPGWYDVHSGEITNVVIEDGVTSIGNCTFIGCDQLASVTMPEGLLSIGNSAFKGCGNLTTADIPSTVTYLGSYAYYGTKITSAVIPGGVKTIREYTFYNLSTLTSLVLGNGVEEIEEYAFFDCNFLRPITMPASVRIIGPYAFKGSDRVSVVFEEGSQLELIDTGAFSDCRGYSDIRLPKGLKTIGASAFSSNNNTRSIVIPDSVTSIGDGAFRYCGLLSEVTLGRGVETIGKSAFDNCPNIASLILHNSLKLIDENAFKACESIPYIFFDGTRGQFYNIDIKIGNDAVYFGDITYPENRCGNNMTWVIEDGVLTISGTGDMWDFIGPSYAPWYEENATFSSVAFDGEITGIGDYAFFYSGIGSIEIPEGVERIGKYAFYNCTAMETVELPSTLTSIGEYAFYNCDHLKSKITLPDGVEVVEPYTFTNCHVLSEIDLGKVKLIKKCAFLDCWNVESFTMPLTLTDIETDAFSATNPDLKVYYEGTADEYGQINIDNNNNENHNVVFTLFPYPDDRLDCWAIAAGQCGDNVNWVLDWECTLTISGTGDMWDLGNHDEAYYYRGQTIERVVIEEGVTSIGAHAFECYGENYSSGLTEVLSVEIADTVRTIGVSAFDNSPLTEIVLPDSVTEIKGYAFDSSALTAIELPDGITAIGEGAFWDCKDLAEVKLPANTESIGAHAFEDCKSLTSIEMPDSVVILGESVFRDCLSLESVHISTNAIKIPDYAFYSTAITSVNIPGKVTEIGGNAFNKCENLTTLMMGNGVKTVKPYAFDDCEALRDGDVYYGGSEAMWQRIDIGAHNDPLIYSRRHVSNDRCGADLVWLVDSSGILRILGTGDMWDYATQYTKRPWDDMVPFIKGIYIDENVTHIGDYAFQNITSVSGSIELPDTVESVGYHAFYGLDKITSVTIGSGVNEIEVAAFGGCNAITDVYYNGSKNDWDKISIAGQNQPLYAARLHFIGYPDNSCGDNLTWTLDGNTLRIEGTGDMWNWADHYRESAPWHDHAQDIENVVISDGATSVGASAFYGYETLKSVELGSGIKVIHIDAFTYSGITSIDLPESLELILDNAFEGCAFLTSVEIPDNVTEIAEYAFYNSGLTSVVIGSVNSIGLNAFWDCDFLASVELSEGITEIRDGAFYETALTSVVLPESVSILKDHVFGECDNLEYVVVPNRECSFDYGYGSNVIDHHTVIYGYTGSTAQTYAENMGNQFVPLDPAPPQNLGAEAAGNNSVLLSWDAGEEYIDGYVVYRSESENGEYTDVGTTDGTTFTDTGLTADETYYYSVSSYVTLEDKRYEGERSEAVSVVPTNTPVEALELDKNSLMLAPGETAALTATVTPADSTVSVTWSTSDETIATVSENGVVTAVAAGTATVTATAGDKQATCEITVTELTGVEGFVTRLYQVCLDRKPDASGLSHWVEELTSGRQTGTQVAYNFVFSNEFKRKNLCNEHYLRQIYVAIMGRDADEDGFNHWMGQMKNGMTREAVFNNFTTSREFNNICSSYGINAGSPIALPQYGTVPTGPCSICGEKDNVTQFVERMYTEVLGRTPDAAGLQDWTTRLWNHTATGRSVAGSFIFSNEYISKNTSDKAYVRMLYKTMMNRDADTGGLNDWLTRMKNGSSRQDVFNSFVSSNEFNKICNNYGITRG